MFVAISAMIAPAASAQNAPPKPATDCGVTAMCPGPTQPVGSDQAPLWLVELAMFVGIALLLLLGYRLLLARRLR
jgi:hypothetical protein